MVILPDDIIELIIHHNVASKIQKIFRNFMFRFTKQKKWKEFMILTASRRDFFAKLCNYYWIRREWLTELDSWLHSLKNEEHNIIKIEEELNIGNM